MTGPFAADVGEGFDVEVFLAVDDVRGWGVDGGGGEGAKVPLEVGDVDDGVAADVGGKVDFVDDVGTGFEHWVRAVELRAEFPTSAGGGGGIKEGGFNPDEIPGGEGDVVAVAVGGESLCSLGLFEPFADTAVDGGHVTDEVWGVGGAEVGGIGGEGGRGAGVVTMANKEGRFSCGGVD